jgi:hypothetical protein
MQVNRNGATTKSNKINQLATSQYFDGVQHKFVGTTVAKGRLKA